MPRTTPEIPQPTLPPSMGSSEASFSTRAQTIVEWLALSGHTNEQSVAILSIAQINVIARVATQAALLAAGGL